MVFYVNLILEFLNILEKIDNSPHAEGGEFFGPDTFVENSTFDFYSVDISSGKSYVVYIYSLK